MTRGVIKSDDVKEVVMSELLPQGKDADASDVQCAVRLLPYVDYAVKNGGVFHASALSYEEVALLEYWNERGLIKLNDTPHDYDCGVAISARMFEIINKVLWDAYVLKF